MALRIIEKLLPVVDGRRINTSGPRGQRARAIVWHVAEGSESGVTSWFHNPASGASTHYLVCKDGRVIRYVPEDETPWANGAINKPNLANPVVKGIVESGINPNRLTISIETEGYTAEYRSADSPLGRALAELTREIMLRHGIPLTDDHILGHNEIDSVNRGRCPGNLDWAGLLAAVKGGGDAPPVGGGEVREPQADSAAVYVNARGETVAVVNFGGVAVKADANFADIGVTVENSKGERYDRTLRGGVMLPWNPSPPR